MLHYGFHRVLWHAVIDGLPEAYAPRMLFIIIEPAFDVRLDDGVLVGSVFVPL